VANTPLSPPPPPHHLSLLGEMQESISEEGATTRWILLFPVTEWQ